MHDIEFYNGIVMNVIRLRLLNVYFFASNYPIDFPFTGGIYQVIRGLYTKYLRNLNFFINLVFLEILQYIFILLPCKDIVQLKFIRNI